jgi:hypothetical protein
MSIGAVLALIRDAAILAGVGFTLWYVMHAEHNADELRNIKATLGQQQQWQGEQTRAASTANSSLNDLNARLDALDKRGPVVVRIPVPAPLGSTAAAGSAPANACPSAPGASDGVRSIDIRPVLEGPERRIATAMIECRQALDAWPH